MKAQAIEIGKTKHTGRKFINEYDKMTYSKLK